MSIEKIERELREKLEGVTPGPWRMHVPDRGYCAANYILTDAPEFAPVEGKWPWKHLIADFDDCERGEINAAFIALCSPENIRALLDELSRLREVERRLREALEPFAEFADDMDADGRDLKDSDGIYAFIAGHFRAARRALSEREGQE